MTKEEKAYKRFFWAFTTFVLTMGIALFMLSCKTEYIPVETSHTEHYWHTDSIKQVDSVIHEKQTTIMQLDSAAMAQYGIQLKNAERAWLVKSWELERQIENLQRLTAYRDTIRDTIQVPYPVEKKVPAEINGWQWFQIWAGRIALCLLALISIIIIIRFYIRKHGFS